MSDTFSELYNTEGIFRVPGSIGDINTIIKHYKKSKNTLALKEKSFNT